MRDVMAALGSSAPVKLFFVACPGPYSGSHSKLSFVWCFVLSHGCLVGIALFQAGTTGRVFGFVSADTRLSLALLLGLLATNNPESQNPKIFG